MSSAVPGQVDAPKATSNTVGVLGLVCGILSIVALFTVFIAVASYAFLYILGILGVVLGRMGQSKAKNGLATNGGMAKAGFITGIIGLAFTTLFLLGYIFIWSKVGGVVDTGLNGLVCGTEGQPAC